MVEIKKLDNGVQVVLEEIDYVRSISFGIWVRNGSRNEVPEFNGMSHFIEHMLFKGTENRTAKQIAEEILEKSSLLTTAFDMVITSRDKIMPVDAVVISNHTVFGYAHDPKTDTEMAAKHISDILAENHYTKVTVKIFSEYVPFLSRVEGLNNMIEVNHSADKELEEAIRQIILNISM